MENSNLEVLNNERLTTKKDIKILQKKYKLSSKYAKLLWSICKKNQVPEITNHIKDFKWIQDIFKNAYNYLKETNANDEQINDFYKLLYKMEQISTESRKIPSKRSIPLSTILFYITAEFEQYPLFVIENKENYYCLELPDFIYKTSVRPQPLSRLRLMMKTKDGVSYFFISRLLRYEIVPGEDIKMVLSHTQKLDVQMQRHYHRETFDAFCSFSPVHVTASNKNDNTTFTISDKEYDGRITNISGGGACIKTMLPIREGQYMALHLRELKINEPIIGIIKRTRKLTDGSFALHVQFISFSLHSQNAILGYVYKYEL